MSTQSHLYEQVLARMARDTEHEKLLMLSVLIPSIPARHNQMIRLKVELLKQISYCRVTHPALGKIELILDDSKSFRQGGLSIGQKREALVKRANAKYLCFLDDDESISPDYLETLLRLCYENKDVCTFRSLAKLSNNWALIDMSIRNENQQINPMGITRRTPWHICPVRTEFAKLYGFPDSNYGEDYQWFEQVLKHCQHEAHTDKIVHNYNHGVHSEADKILKA